jgi:hypothetical protein
VRSRPPASSPLRVPVAPTPPQCGRCAIILMVLDGPSPEGPAGPGVNGLTLGPLRLLSQALPAGQKRPAVENTRIPLPLFAIARIYSCSAYQRGLNVILNAWANPTTRGQRRRTGHADDR